MPNVLGIVSYTFLPPKMGGQKGIALFYKFLSRYINLTCVTTKNNDTSYTHGYTAKTILSNNQLRYINIFYFFTLRKIIKENKITHVMIEHPYYGWLGVLLKWFCKVKLIVHSHNIEAVRFKSMGKWWWSLLWNYEKFTHKRANVNFFIQDDDKEYAIKNFKLDKAKCFTITYGFEIDKAPDNIDRMRSREIITSKYNINQEDTLILFNGTLNYKPNLNALLSILNNINPLLLKTTDFRYKILICGKDLPKEFDELKQYLTENIIYAGFVDDINLYFKATDIFINPVIDGGGIKTKLVEALGYDLNVITTASGAIGVPQELTINKMKIVEDNDTSAFAKAIVNCNTSFHIPQVFFNHFYWGAIAQKAATVISTV